MEETKKRTGTAKMVPCNIPTYIVISEDDWSALLIEKAGMPESVKYYQWYIPEEKYNEIVEELEKSNDR